MAFQSFIFATGSKWGRASMAWAADRLAYRGEAVPFRGFPGLKLNRIGAPARAVTPEGVTIFSAEDQPADGHALASAYADRRWRSDAAQVWHSNLLLAIDPGRKTLSLLVGEFYHQGRFLAVEDGSAFFAPEIKAFSDVDNLSSIERLPAGCSVTLGLEDGRIERRDLRSDWPLPEHPIPYAEAVRRCRDLMEQGLDAALEQTGPRFAVAFSGGVDSSILVYRLAARGIPIHAYHVWFDPGDGAIPEDLAFARRVAADLGFDLREIRLGLGDALRWLPETIYLGELRTAQELESALYFPPMLEAMKADGFRSKMSGDGCDTFFAGYDTFAGIGDDAAFREHLLYRMRYGGASHIGSYQDAHGVRLYEPYAARPLIDFALTLPRAYMEDLDAPAFTGKRIVRDAFRGRVPDFVLDRPKGIPRLTNGTERMLEQRLGDREQRDHHYRRMWRRLGEPPRLGRTPAWAIRAGLAEARHRRRLKAALRHL